MDQINRQDKIPYDFNKDPLQFLIYKKLLDLQPFKKKLSSPKKCGDLLGHVKHLINEFKNQYERKDLWRETPTKERAWGRIFRALGDLYFSTYPAVSFLEEVQSGRGPADFVTILNDCRITIELKFLKNDVLAGDSKTPAYLHGITSQLPNYTINLKAQYAFYVTGQHFKASGRGGKNHDSRANEVRAEIQKSTKFIQGQLKGFKELRYVNIDLTPKKSFSKA